MQNSINLESKFFPDKRLARRANLIISTMIHNPNVTIPNISVEKSFTKGLYRFLENIKFDHKSILNSYVHNTIRAFPKNELIIIAQDTSDLDFTGLKETSGLGYLDSKSQKYKKQSGLKFHTALALSEDGEVFGILDQKIYSREGKKPMVGTDRSKLPTEDKESYRWIETVKNIDSLEILNPILIVGDRESDMTELFELGTSDNIQLLVRARHSRCVDDGSKVLEYMKSINGFKHTTLIPSYGEKHDENVELSITYSKIKLKQQAIYKPPKEKRETPQNTKKLFKPSVELNCILAYNKERQITWLLFTTLEINSNEDAVNILGYYKKRWLVERYHYTLKSGCKMEELQLKSKDNLSKALVLYSIVACQLLKLWALPRVKPNLLATEIFSKEEIDIIVATVDKIKLRKNHKSSYTLAEITIKLGILGGFMGRKGDGMPGIKVLWRGLMKLNGILKYTHIFVGNG
jgi:hypothetical protein